MNRKNRKVMYAGVFVTCALGIAVGLAGASGLAGLTPGFGITSTPIAGPTLMGPVDVGSETDGHEVEIKTRGNSDVFVSHLRLIPGGHGGWHSHPGPSIISVKAGQATFYHADDPDRTAHNFPAGTGFMEDGGDVHILRNEGSVDLEIAVVQIVPAGAPRRVDQPKPDHYDF